MSDIPNLYHMQFRSNTELALQADQDNFSPRFTQESFSGKKAEIITEIGALEMQQVTTRGAPMVVQESSFTPRWMYPATWDLTQHTFTEADMIRMLEDPKSKFLMTAVASAKRRKTRTCLAAFFGTAYIGEEGNTADTWAATYTDATGGMNVKVAHGAAAATGLTVAKLLEARRVLLANEVDLDMEPAYVGITSKQDSDLLKDIQITNRDFNSTPVLEKGKVASFLGFNFVHSELISTGTDELGSTSYGLPVWVPSGMHFGTWDGLTTSVTKRNDIRGEPHQLYTALSFGASRGNPKKIARIWAR